ncbi:MAG TPA: OB-fold domain-containing protein [Candidatus Dormibacteraeota bacterium]|nr:OB-fold domain-containing protein [Candidatus Dormibacteraeota bacterium]
MRRFGVARVTEVLSRPQRPLPVIDEATAPFWAAARQGMLAILRCERCRRWRNPPSPVCPDCWSEEAEWEPVSGLGTVSHFTVLRQPRVRGFEAAVPYAVVVVELDEQAGLLFVSNLVEADPDTVRIGMRVQLRFEPLEGGLRLPQFAPVRNGGR